MKDNISQPLISVIVTTFNRESLLRETLVSIINQTYKNIEIIVVDNNSDYNFFQLIESFNDNRIKPYQNQNNGVIARNRNFGIRKATSNIIAFCDDDDLWSNDKIEKQINKVNLNEVLNASYLIYSDVYCFTNLIELKRSYRSKASKLNDLLLKNQIPFSSALVVNIENFRFDEDNLLVACEDYELWLNLAYNNFKIIFINEPLVYYRMNANSAYHATQNLVHLRNIYTIIKFIYKNPIGVKSLFWVTCRVCVEFFKIIIKKILYKI